MKLKVLAVMLGTAALAGCASDHSHKHHSNHSHRQPVVQDVHLNMTEATVRSIAGDPASTYRRKSRIGTCYNYVVQGRGKTSPYFVSFDATGIVDQKGYKTCQEFDRSQGLISEPGNSNSAEGF